MTWHEAARSEWQGATPRTVLNGPVAVRNIERWQRAVSEAGKHLRPHFKAHKVVPLTLHQLAVGAVGLEVSRVREIQLAIDAGIDTQFVLSWIHDKPKVWDAVAALNAEGHQVIADVDSVGLLQGYAAAAARHGVRLPVRVQVDSGLRGCPVPEVEALCAAVVASPQVELWGLTGYRSLYARDETRNWLPFDVIGRQEGQLLADLRDRVAEGLGLDGIGVLCGSTAITRGALEVAGVDEVAGASYVLGDWGLAQLGLCQTTDIAVGVVTTVVDVVGSTVVIDAGANVFGRWDPYPGIAEPVVAATPDGRIRFETMTPDQAVSCVVDEGALPRVGERLFVYPAQVSELVNVPGSFVVVGEDGERTGEWGRLSSGYYSPDDEVI